MARDYGDPNPSDIGDTKPASPTANFAEGGEKRTNRASPSPNPAYGFDERVDVNESFTAGRHVWVGTLIDSLGDGNWTVLLQNGKEVTGRDIFEIPGYSFIEAQEVTVIAGQRQGDFQIIGQKFDTQPEVEYLKLDSILTVGGSATGKKMLSLGDAGWGELDVTVTVYDSFYRNYGLIGEVLPYAYNIDTQTACIIGSQGTRRLGVATTGITTEASGPVQVYDKDGTVPDAIITAWLTWMHNGQNITAGKEVFIEWFIEFEQWIVVGRQC